uniref:MADF domain-containing protein n=1 Tax=Glossina palpalis gambiensis TaxID=67801 RepID=A0A1B0APE6_9MUSC
MHNTTQRPSANINIVNSLDLINAVRKHEILYNRAANGYTNIKLREHGWEKVALELFPHYINCSDYLRDQIRMCVRQRWKKLRDDVTCKIRNIKSVENYTRKKEGTLLAQLEFLIPFINSPSCTRLAQELGLQKNTSNPNVLLDDDDENEFENCIDLTSDDNHFDNNLSITEATQRIDFEVDNTHLNEVTSSAPEYQNEMQQTDENDSNIPEECEFLSSSPRSCKVTDENLESYNEGNDDNETNNPGNENSSNSRKRLNFENDNTGNYDTDVQTQILTYLSNIEKRQRLESQNDNYNQDEDRMFLLSLVSDLKRVPAASKMLVKAEITASIARAVDQQKNVFS